MRTRQGIILNERELVAAIRSARSKGRRDIAVTGIPRPVEREEAKKRRPPFRFLSSKELQFFSPEDFRRYIEDAEAYERSKS